VFVVDDNSDDETAGTARSAAGNNTAKLYIISEMPLAGGWSGKLWAINQDIEASQNLEGSFKYILLTDADIIHTPGNLRWLVGKAEISVLDLVSKMVMLRCQSFWKKTINSSLRFLFPKALPISSG
jgi:glycosyltransferase involved in cell wall biosynthesis